MMFTGVLLIVCAAILYWRAYTERRPWAHIGFCCMTLAVALSGFRRITYTPGEFLAQVQLDLVVCSVFFAGAVCLALDAWARALNETGGGGRFSQAMRRVLGALVIPAFLVLLSAGPWTWDGQRFDALTFEQAMAAIDKGMNVPAAAQQAKALAAVAIDKLQAVVEMGSPEDAAFARHKLRCLKSKLEKLD